MQGWGSEWEKKRKTSRGHSVSLSALHFWGQTTMIPNTPSHFIAIPHCRSLDCTGEICLFLTWSNYLFVCFPWRPILGCLWSHWGAEAQHTNTACCDGQRQAGMSCFQCSLCSGPYVPESHTGRNAAFPRKGGGRIVSPLLKTLEKIQTVWVTADKYCQAFIFHLSLPQPIPKAPSALQLAPDLILTHPSSTVPPPYVWTLIWVCARTPGPEIISHQEIKITSGRQLEPWLCSPKQAGGKGREAELEKKELKGSDRVLQPENESQSNASLLFPVSCE